MKSNLFFTKSIKNNLLILSLLALCGCYDPPCPDPYDPATMEFREYVKSLDGKYRFRKLYINGVDSTSILDSIRITGHLLRTYDYDAPILEKNPSGCNDVKYFTSNGINSIDTIVPIQKRIRTWFLLATRDRKPNTLVLWLYSNHRDTLYPTQFVEYPLDFIQSKEYRTRVSNDTLSFTSNNQGREIKLLLY